MKLLGRQRAVSPLNNGPISRRPAIIDGTANPALDGSPVNAAKGTRAAFRLILVLFFFWGFLTCLNDVLLPYLKHVFSLSFSSAVSIPVTFFSTCFVFAPIAGRLISRLGYKRVISGALLAMGAGSMCFLLAACLLQFWCFLAAILILGTGITALQVAAAPYVSFLGPRSGSPSRFSLALGFNSLGTVIAPLFGSRFILSHWGPIETESVHTPATLIISRLQAAHQIRLPYMILGISLMILSAVVCLSHLPPIKHLARSELSEGALRRVLRHKPLAFGALTSFLYSGAEIGIGSLLINYLSLRDVGNMAPRSAAVLVSFYWGGATLGRFIGWRVLKHHRVETVLALCGTGAAVLLISSVGSTGTIAVTSILMVGLCNSLIVPIVVMLAISGLGADSAIASSVMTATNIGGAVMPLAMGILADSIGLHTAYLLPVISYLFVVYYALHGCRQHRLQEESPEC